MGKKKKEQKPDHIGMGVMLAWNSRQVSVAVLNLAMTSYLLLYCNTVLGLNTAVISMILVVGKVLDGFTDAVAGYIVDKTKTRWGKGRPYEVFIVLAWLFTWLMYSTPTGMSDIMKYIWVFFMYTMANSVCYTFLNANTLPYSLRAFTPEQMVPLTSYGSIFVLVGAALYNILGPSLYAAAGTDAGLWSRLVGMLAVPLALIGLLRMFCIKETIDVDSGAAVKAEDVKIKDYFTLFKTNTYVTKTFIMRLVYAFVSAMSISTYYYTYVVGNLALAGIAAMATMIAIPMMFFVPMLLRRMNVVTLIRYGFIVAAVGWLINFFAIKNIPILAFAAILTGGGVVPVSMLSGLALIECADYNEWSGMPRMEGSMSALSGLADKIGNAFGTGVLGIVLEVSGVSAAASALADGTLSVMADAQLLWIRLMFSIIPFVIYAIVILILMNYDLGKKIPGIRADLEVRRAENIAKAQAAEGTAQTATEAEA